MAGLPVECLSHYGRNDPFLINPDPASKFTTSHHSSPSKSSTQSSKSRVTLIEYDQDLEPESEVTRYTTNNPKDYSWFDHLLAVLCISRRSKKKPMQLWRNNSTAPGDREVYSQSPWILSVYVLSTTRDESRHLIPREAKCTIDTGNLQGNIVSRNFVVNVLGYSELSFHKLTQAEEDGGIGVTGHKLIPKGIVYLTWYHSNSTRVFRDMRFLVSENPSFDLIIGARSIQRYNILDVPNLTITAGGAMQFDEDLTSDLLQSLLATMNGLREEVADKEKALRKLRVKALQYPEDPEYRNLTKQHRQALEAYETEGIRLLEEKDKKQGTTLAMIKRGEFKIRHKREVDFQNPLGNASTTSIGNGKSDKKNV